MSELKKDPAPETEAGNKPRLLTTDAAATAVLIDKTADAAVDSTAKSDTAPQKAQTPADELPKTDLNESASQVRLADSPKPAPDNAKTQGRNSAPPRSKQGHIGIISALVASTILALALCWFADPPTPARFGEPLRAEPTASTHGPSSTTQQQDSNEFPQVFVVGSSRISTRGEANRPVILERWRAAMLAAILGMAMCCFGHLFDLQRQRHPGDYRAPRLGGGMDGGLALEGLLTLGTGLLLVYLAISAVSPRRNDDPVKEIPQSDMSREAETHQH